MVLTVTEDTPADMLAGSMELLVQLPRDHHLHTQRVTVQRSTPMMDLLVQITTAHKLTASSYTLQAIGERGLVLPHQPNTPIGALDALQVKLLPKQGTFASKKTKPANQPFETTFRLQVHLPRNQLYVSRVSPKMNLGEILEEVCREKNLDKQKYELRHPVNLEETLDLRLSLQDYHLQEVTLYAKQGRTLGPALSSQDIMALQRQEERRRQQAKQSVFGFMFKKSKESSLSTDSLEGRSVSPARSDETGRSASPLQPPARPQRKRRPAPKPPVLPASAATNEEGNHADSSKDKMVISHSRNSSDSSGYHEASVLSDNPESARLPETLPRRSRAPGPVDAPRKLAQTSSSSKSLGNLAATSGGGTLNHAISSTSLSSTGLRKKRAAPPPPASRPLSSAISTQALERIVDSEESLTSDMDPSKPPSDIGAPSKASSDIDDRPKANSDIGVCTTASKSMSKTNGRTKSDIAATSKEYFDDNSKARSKFNFETNTEPSSMRLKLGKTDSDDAVPVVEDAPKVETARLAAKRVGVPAPLPKPRKLNTNNNVSAPPEVPKRRIVPPLVLPRTLSKDSTKESCSHPSPTVNISELANSSNLVVNDTDMSSMNQKRSDSSDIDKIGYGDAAKVTESISSVNSIDSPTVNISISAKSNNLVADDTERTLSMDKKRNDRTDIGKIENTVAMTVKKSILDNRSIDSKMIRSNESSQMALKVSDDKSTDNEDNEITSTFFLISDGNIDEVQFASGRNQNREKKLRHQRKLKASMKYAKSMDDIYGACSRHDKKISRSSSQNSELCTVISTIPKCDHFDDTADAMNISKTITHSARSSSCDKLDRCLQYNVKSLDDTNEEFTRPAYNDKTTANVIDKFDEEVTKLSKRSKICRSQSELNDFETNSFKKQKRHLTSQSEDITFALNINLASRNSSLFEPRNANASQEQQKKPNGLVKKADADNNLSDTDILLRKVSDTLSSTLPANSTKKARVTAPAKAKEDRMDVSRQEEAGYETIVSTSSIKNDKNLQKASNLTDQLALSTNASNMTISSQQDTSDYVSAVGDDLSIAEWEYQLPAPPSAFRDTNSPVFDGYDTITLRSVDAFNEPDNDANENNSTENSRKLAASNAATNVRGNERISNNSLPRALDKGKLIAESIDENDNVKTINHAVASSKKPLVDTSRTDVSSELKKEIISELKSNLETGVLFQTSVKESDSRKVTDNSSTPKIAPVDNTLSNFTITTYTRQKTLNIFDEPEAQTSSHARSSDERVIKTFATMSRNKNAPDYSDNKNPIKNSMITVNAASQKTNNVNNKFGNVNDDSEDCSESKPKTFNQCELINRWQAHDTDKSNIQRSKSYLSISSKSKLNEKNWEDDENIKSSVNHGKNTNTLKSSLTNLNTDIPRSNEKFSQWRENILKRQEEPSKEKQLQSLQVLKSILPQLKNSQQAEENVSGLQNIELREKSRVEITSNKHSVESNVSSIRESPAISEVEYRKTVPKEAKEANTKRYTYAGPPAISLGSWSERPSVNVQIKTDTDYKLGTTNIIGGKTVVNINNTKDRNDGMNCASNSLKTVGMEVSSSDSTETEKRIERINLEKKGTDDLTKKLITHTTASGFKKPILNKVSGTDSNVVSNKDDRPFVTGVELKKPVTEKQEIEQKNEIDTTPLNFKELTKTFGQDISLRSKPKRFNVIQHSDQRSSSQKIVDLNSKQNGFVKSDEKSSKGNFIHKESSIITKDQCNSQTNTKRFTSIVGINSQNQNCGLQNGNISMKNNVNTLRINPSLPTVKGFKMQTSPKESITSNVTVNQNGLQTIGVVKNSSQPPKPPTMPVIMGVTLKSANARPKSMPAQIDSRDMLLDAIRNFGGREKLKHVSIFA